MVIGGYFEIELNNFGRNVHPTAIALNSGRNALEYILLTKQYSKIHLPYYACDALLQPLKRLNINYEFYYIDKNLLPKKQSIESNEALLYINYFGLMDKNVKKVLKKYDNIIIDNTQAYYSKPHRDVPTFYSPRKFFGVPDGGYLYSKTKLNLDLEQDISNERLEHLFIRVEEGAEKGYEFFKKNDAKLNNLPINKMSKLTEKLLNSIDYENVLKKRNSNFMKLHDSLTHKNEFSFVINNQTINGPLMYPFLTNDGGKLRNNLHNQKIFTATYWPNVLNWLKDKTAYENYLVENLIALPIDQRYTKEDMIYIYEIISRFLK